MPKKRSPESELETPRDSIPESADYWFREFIADFERNYIDACHRLRTAAERPEFATVHAVFQTLIESGMTAETVVELFGQVAIDRPPGSVQWNAELNQRRFALIDKEIQGTLTPAEKVELAGLTGIMREQLEPRTERRHGPAGYASYESYRPWLRDEFSFRCVYCLKRETWGQVTGEFELDHFESQSVNPDRRLDYLNLVYACRRCNSVKLDQTVGDPFQLLHSDNVAMLADGSLRARDSDTRLLILQLDLNSPRLKSWRNMWTRIVDLAERRDADLYHQLAGVPNDLPNLGKLRPPRNDRKEGIAASWFARRQRSELPNAY